MSQTSSHDNCVCVVLSADGISDRVKGEYPGWGAKGAPPQHGLQPERPLPPALFCHTKGTGVQGKTKDFFFKILNFRSSLSFFSDFILVFFILSVFLSALVVS